MVYLIKGKQQISQLYTASTRLIPSSLKKSVRNAIMFDSKTGGGESWTQSNTDHIARIHKIR